MDRFGENSTFLFGVSSSFFESFYMLHVDVYFIDSLVFLKATIFVSSVNFK